MKEAVKINEIDHAQMMKDFETNSRHEEHLKRIHKKWASESRKYNQTIKKMKELREENYIKKSNAMMEKLNKKEQTLITSLQNIEKDKLKEKEKAIALMIQRENNARENVQKYLDTQERNRLLFEKRTNQKIESFKERNLLYKEMSQKIIRTKNEESVKRHEKNMIRVLSENDEIVKATKEKCLQKYIGFYWQRKALEREKKKKYKKTRNKLIEKTEKLEEIEKENETKRTQILSKIKTMVEKKEKFDLAKLKKNLEFKKERDEKFLICKTNRENLAEEETQKRQEILDYQFELINKFDEKKRNINKILEKKNNPIECQKNFVKNLGLFNKKMNQIKEMSVLRKTNEEKLKMYLDMKKAEEEKRKKEIEDKLLEKMK